MPISACRGTLKQQGQQRGLRALLHEHSKDDLIHLLCEIVAQHGLMEDIYYRLHDAEDEF